MTTSEWKVNHWSGWLARTITGVAGTWSRHILRWCHIHVITPKTYSALLAPKAYDSPHVWNEFVRITKHSLRSIFRYYDVCMTHFLCSFKYNDLPFEHTTTAKKDIRANSFQMLLNHALTSTCNKNVAELRNHGSVFANTWHGNQIPQITSTYRCATPWKRKITALQAAGTALLVAGLAQ